MSISSINRKPYWKVSNNRFHIFPRIILAWEQHLPNFTFTGSIEKLWKFTQDPSMQTREIHNSYI
jgi:hypothetical protein